MIYLLLATCLTAQEPPQSVQDAIDALPAHTKMRCRSKQVVCFEFEPFKELLQQSGDRLHLMEENVLLHLKMDTLDRELAALEAVADLTEKRAILWEKRHDEMLVKWREENRLRHQAEISANSPWPVVTTVVGALVGITGAVWGIFNSEEAGPWVLVGTGTVVTTVGLIDLVF